MPNRDGTGPEGKGAKTGKGLGNCKTSDSDSEIQNFGRRSRRGRAFGKKHRNRGR